MTVREALAEGAAALQNHETETPRLDAALLLAHVRGVTRERLYMDLAESMTPAELDSFRGALDRRVSGEPVAWIIGRKEFWGLEFAVGPGVLCPRPDSEILVEAALEIMEGMTDSDATAGRPSAAGTPSPVKLPAGSGRPSATESTPAGPGDSPSGTFRRLHDCCCGPGTLALALARERPDWEIGASDISGEAALYFAENNARLCAGRVTYTHADLMDGIDGPFDVIVSNPPYLTPRETAERTALGWREPVLALDGGGKDGLDVIRRLIPHVFDRLVPGGAVLMEADPLQMPMIGEILVGTGFEGVRIRRDLGDRDRVIIARRRGGI